MGRVPALKAEFVFYWIKQEKRKRRNAVANLEAKQIYFYKEAKLNAQHVVVDHEVDLPQSPFNSTNGAHEKEPVEFHNEFHHGAEPIHTNYGEQDCEKDCNADNGDDDELMHLYNNENNNNEDKFHSEVKSPAVSLVIEQQNTDVYKIL